MMDAEVEKPGSLQVSGLRVVGWSQIGAAGLTKHSRLTVEAEQCDGNAGAKTVDWIEG